MPFLSIFRKDRDSSKSSGAPESSSALSQKSSFRSRPSFTSSRPCTSPPPQLGNLSPQSDLDYVLPELDEFNSPQLANKPLAEISAPDSSVKQRRGLAFGRRRESAVATSPSATTKTPSRPFSETFDAFISRENKDQTRPDRDRHTSDGSNINNTLKTRHDAIHTPKISSHSNLNSNQDDSDDDPLVPPPARASVFAGFTYTDKDRPRAQSAPDVDAERPERERPPRPQVHPHQLAREKHKSADWATLASASSAPSAMAILGKSKQKARDSSTPSPKTSGGLFGWRSKSSKEVPPASPASTPAPTTCPVSADPPDSSFSLKSFRHVGPNTTSITGSSLVEQGSEAGGLASPPSSFGRAGANATPGSTSTAPTARPVPGRSGAGARERVNSTGSEGMMPAGLFRQAARRSSTNLVEDVAEPIRSQVRDHERRGAPPRAWDARDEGGGASSGSEPPRPIRARPSAAWLDSESERDSTVVGGSSSAIAYVGPRKSTVPRDGEDESTAECPSPFAGRLGAGGRESPFGTRSDCGGNGPKVDCSAYGARSDSGHGSRPAYSAYGGMLGPSSPTASSKDPPVPSSPTKPGPQPYPKPCARSARPSAPAAARPTRSPVRTTIPTKTNDGPSIKPSRMPPKSARPPSPAADMAARSVSVDVVSHTRRASGFEVVSRPKSPGPAPLLLSTTAAANSTRPKTPVGESRPKSPSPSRAKSPVEARPSTPHGGFAPPPRNSSLDLSSSALVDSDSDESPEEESESEDLGVGAKRVPAAAAAKKTAQGNQRVHRAEGFGARVLSTGAAAAMRARNGPGKEKQSKHEHGHERSGSDEKQNPGLSRDRTITQRDRASPTPASQKAPAVLPKIGVSLFDKPMPKLDQEGSSSNESPKSPVDKFGVPPTRAHPRARASHSTSAITAAATARNSAALAEANRPWGHGKHGRHVSLGAAETLRASHTRSPAETTDTDEDEDEEEKSESEESDDAPLSALAPARRPDSAASTVPSTRTTASRPSNNPSRQSMPGPRQSLVNLPGVPAPPRPPRRAPGVGVTRNSSLRGSRSVEDLSRMSMTSAPAVGRPGPRPFAASPPSSTGDSSSGKAPLTPRDGSESGVVRRSDEARRKERRRSEAKASVELANIINGPGPVVDDDIEDHVSAHHSQMGHGGMGMLGPGMAMGWNQPGFFPPGQQMGFPSFPASQSMPFLHPQLTGPQPVGFMPPPPPPGASEAYLVAHRQAMMIAKQTYLSAVAQQAMVAATEQWERSSNMGGGGSVYGGSQMSVNMGMMGMPMMPMYASSAYAASSYDQSVAGGWGSASMFGGPSGARTVYGGGAKSDYGGIKSASSKSPAPGRSEGHTRARSRTHTTPSDNPMPSQQSSNRGSLVPPSTWTARRKGGN